MSIEGTDAVSIGIWWRLPIISLALLARARARASDIILPLLLTGRTMKDRDDSTVAPLRRIIIVHRRQEVDEELDDGEIFGTIIVGKLRTSIVTMACRDSAIITRARAA